jgi:hypothetical protein
MALHTLLRSSLVVLFAGSLIAANQRTFDVVSIRESKEGMSR